MGDLSYQLQAIGFLKETGATISIVFDKTAKHFVNDDSERDIYTVTLARGSRSYTFSFGNSICRSGKYILSPYAADRCKNHIKIYGNRKTGFFSHKMPLSTGDVSPKDYRINENYGPPNEYDILASITKYDPGTFDNFCSEYGYDADSRNAERVYNAVKDEFMHVAMIFTDAELEKLREIN